MLDFFVSYTAADRPWAEWIAWVLVEAGKTVTVQAWDFRPGSNFVIEMQKAASAAERTLVVLSPDYLNSGFAMAEWAAAFAQDPTGEKGTVLPVRVRKVKAEGLLAAIIYIDLVNLAEAAAREKLLAGLARVRVKPAAPPPFPGGPVPAGGGEARPAFPGELNLPVQEIPPPGPLPPGSRMPFSHNPLFVGRETELRILAGQLGAGETAAVGQVEIAAASGMGGIGKTQLASEFVHRYGRFFAGGVFWMGFEKAANVPAEVAACGWGLGLSADFEALPLDRQVEQVEQVWRSAIPRLLVFDNCEDENLLTLWRPPFGGARVLVTSRRTHWLPTLGVRAVPITTLPRSASLEMLRKYRPDLADSDPSLAAIATELGDLPLALHLAGSFLARYAGSPHGQPAAYFQALRQKDLLQHPSLRGGLQQRNPTRHEEDVARTFALSYEQLDAADIIDELALSFLVRAAWLAPGEPIPRHLLLLTAAIDETDPEPSLRAEDALRRLTDLGLLEINQTHEFLIHRLVARFARGAGDGGEARAAVEDALRGEAHRLNNAGYPAPLLAWQAHLRAVTEEALGQGTDTAAGLCNTLGFHLKMIGDYAGVRPYYERALAIWEKILGPDHAHTATSLNNLGELLRSQGDLSGARPYHERALAIREKVLGPDHPDTATSLNNLGLLLKSQGDLSGARPYYERALAIREKVLGPDHPGTATSLNNLGGLLQSQGDLSGAQPYYERALAIREKVLGPDHPHTAQSLNNLGGLLYKQGDLSGARPYYERALAIFKKALGPEHPNTKIARENLEALGAKKPGGGEPSPE